MSMLKLNKPSGHDMVLGMIFFVRRQLCSTCGCRRPHLLPPSFPSPARILCRDSCRGRSSPSLPLPLTSSIFLTSRSIHCRLSREGLEDLVARLLPVLLRDARRTFSSNPAGCRYRVHAACTCCSGPKTAGPAAEEPCPRPAVGQPGVPAGGDRGGGDWGLRARVGREDPGEHGADAGTRHT